MKELEELVDALNECIAQTQVYYKGYQDAKQREDNLRMALKEQMQSTGFLSVKTKALTASIVNKPTIEIKHEQSALEWLKNEPNIEVDEFIGLKVTPFKKLALHRLSEKGGGEIIPGTEMVMNQSLAIRKK